MRYWWVNQNQTFHQETAGGYLWSPKRKSNGALNPYYETMREVSPGDLILSFQGTFIRGVCVGQSHCYECPKPEEFGRVGEKWSAIGWRVDVRFFPFKHQIRPKMHMGVLGPLLPDRYAPLLIDGRGVQNIYLTELPYPLMQAIVAIVGPELTALMRANRDAEDVGDYGRGVLEWEEHERAHVAADPAIDETEKAQIILARRGQGLFKRNVRRLERACRVTKVDRLEHLRASHIKPWRRATNDQRLDGENGLLLTPSIDHLFDRGFVNLRGQWPACIVTGRTPGIPASHGGGHG